MKSTNQVTHYARKNWSPFMDLRNEVDRLFDDFWGTPAQMGPSSSHEWSPACDVIEEKDRYLVALETAGIPKEQIKIEVLNNELVVSGERKSEETKNENGILYSERRYGKFHRRFALPTGLDAEKIEANYDDGVLRIALPKEETQKSKQIKISAGNGNSFFGKLIGQSSTKEKEEVRSFNQKSSDKMAS